MDGHSTIRENSADGMQRRRTAWKKVQKIVPWGECLREPTRGWDFLKKRQFSAPRRRKKKNGDTKGGKFAMILSEGLSSCGKGRGVCLNMDTRSLS